MRAIAAVILFLGSGIFFASPCMADKDLDENLIADSLASYSSFVNPQKVYLHTDRSSYSAGETIWFRAFLLDGITNIPVKEMNNLFVELIDSDGESVMVRMLLSSEGGAQGDIELDSNLPDGNYILRAYTTWMRNFGEEYFFTRHLYIRNRGYENMIRRIDVLRNRLFNWRMERRRTDYEVGFFPEGGELITGTNNRVAFRVVDRLGRGQDAEGEVFDSEGNAVARLKTDYAGIGTFEIEPVPGDEYSAAISVNGERRETYDLPNGTDHGYSLRVDQNDDHIRIRVAAGIGNPVKQEIIIVGHTRGQAHYTGTHMTDREPIEIVVDKTLFPSGIAHFTVFTSDYKPVAERLIFIDRMDMLRFSASIDTVDLFNRDYINFSVNVTDHLGNSVDGTFSLSAVTGKPDQDSHSPGIMSYMLFTSDLGDVLELPDLYIEQSPDGMPEADLLLLTYGWRRFKWEAVLAGEMPPLNYSGQPGLTIAGRVMDPAGNTPIEGHPLLLTIKSGHDKEFRTTSNQRGYFAFPNLYYEGVVRMELSGRRTGSNYPPEIELNVSEPWGYDIEPSIHTRKRMVTARGDDWQRVRARSGVSYASAPGRIAVAQEFGRPDQTIFLDHENLIEHNVLEVLQNKAVGLIVEGDYVRLSGLTSVYGRNEVEYMINGNSVNRNWFISTPVRDIERLEIFRHSSTVAFGSRGGSGVVIAYIKEPGYTGLVDVLDLNVQGYYEVRDFYTDVLSYQQYPANYEEEHTIYWEPRLVPGPDGRMNFFIPINDFERQLNIVIQGAGYNGNLGYSNITLEK